MNEISNQPTARLSEKLYCNWVIMLVTMATPISAHVKDKNSIFTARGEDMIFEKKEKSWYFISIYVIKKPTKWRELSRVAVSCMTNIFRRVAPLAEDSRRRLAECTHQSFETPAPPIRALAGDCGHFHLMYTSFWFPGRREFA